MYKVEYSPEPVVIGKQHGDNWDICYCSRNGNSTVGGRVVRHGHIVHLNEHPVVSIHDYRILVKRWNEISGPMHRVMSPMNYFMCNSSIEISNFPSRLYTIEKEVIFKVSLAILRVQPGSLIVPSESFVCMECLTGCASQCVGVKIESVPHNITKSTFVECLNYQVSEYIYFLRKCEETLLEYDDDRVRFVRELLSEVCHNSVDSNIRTLCGMYDAFSPSYVKQYTVN